MENEIKNKIKERKKGKGNVNLTLDITLLKKLQDFKKRNNIEQLSPMINEMLWSWLEGLEKEKEN